MFDSIAKRYDLLNRLISLGIDQSWRRKTVRELNLGANAKVLDLATGTADLALLIAKTHQDAQVTGLDPSKEMMAVGQRKIDAKRLAEQVTLVEGNAETLPFETNSFDGISMAFGIRNVPDRPRALREMARVTRPGGRVCILELSEPQSGLLAGISRFHMHKVVPWLGGVISGSKEYRYLPQSIAAFPPCAKFESIMQDAGLDMESSHVLSFGVCHLYVATPTPNA